MITAVVALKGGVGKTTAAVYFALALAEGGERVVLIDADRQASALHWADEYGGLGPSVFAVGGSTPEAMRSAVDLASGAEVVIDTPPGDLRLVRAALSCADMAIIPVRPTMLDLDRLEETLDLVRDAGIPAAILLNQVRARTRSLAAARLAIDQLELPLLDTVIGTREAIAASFGAAADTVALGLYGAALSEMRSAIALVKESL